MAQKPAQTKTSAVHVDLSTGAHFKDIFVQILLKTMGGLQSALTESEADRAARLNQINELTAWLKESEADRAARLKVIEAQQVGIHDLTEALEKMVERARAAEEGWRILEASFAVRYGRKMGLIKESSANKLDKIALRFKPGWAESIEQNHRRSRTTMRIL